MTGDPSTNMDRRQFLRWGAMGAGAAAFAGPLLALADRAAAGAPVATAGFGPLIDVGELLLPRGFEYRIISRSGDRMTDGNATPNHFDGMAAYRGPDGNTILMRNHENRRSTGRTNEISVNVPREFRYDPEARFNAGVTKLVVSPERDVVEDFAVLGGTSTNCAGGKMPWRSWITCEEVFQDGGKAHGFCFEVSADATGPVKPRPIRAAGRFVHEAVAWHDGVLYETEDQHDSCFYRFLPEVRPRRRGDLAANGGLLQALAVEGIPTADTRVGWPIGQAFPATWVDIDEPQPTADTLRLEAQSKGAAIFDRLEGAWAAGGMIFFDCTTGGAAELGQIWQYDPAADAVTLVYESNNQLELKNPDNLTVTPAGHLLICEDSRYAFIRGLTPEGGIYDFAVAARLTTEFAGACFSPDRRTLFVNQYGRVRADEREPGVTYAIWGPWQAAG